MNPSPSELPLRYGFAPLLDHGTRILVMGSFPGDASLKAGQYYAHPRNQFWRLMSALLGDDLASLPYENRIQRLLLHRIGLWDVLAACEREGSLDADIRRPQANEFSVLRHQCPALFRVCFNGKAAGRFAPFFAQAGFESLVLPSSSPASAQLSFDEKLHAWRAMLAQ